MTDKRLYAVQLTALQGHFDYRVFVFLDHATIRGIANELLATPLEKFTLIGLSLSGYIAFKVIRRAPYRLERLVLIDAAAVAHLTERIKAPQTILRKYARAVLKPVT